MEERCVERSVQDKRVDRCLGNKMLGEKCEEQIFTEGSESLNTANER